MDHSSRRRAPLRLGRTATRRSWAYAAIGGALLLAGAFVAGWIRFRQPGIRIERILAAYQEGADFGKLNIEYPLDATLFPPEIVPPTFRWRAGPGDGDTWVVTLEFADGGQRMDSLCADPEWTPADADWTQIKQRSLRRPAKVTILGVNRARQEEILSAGSVSISTSPDEVGAPIFYREVALPFLEAVKDPAKHIRWRFGAISSGERPPVVLENLPVCANCHSFSSDGATMGMDVDYANDRGAYILRPVEREMWLDKDQIFTWSDFRREDKQRTFGLLSQVSPDGRYVVSTVKDQSVFVPRPDLAFSQLFFPVQGILAVRDRKATTFFALPGADDRQFVQSNPTWSPDGKYIVFARAEAHRLKNLRDEKKVLLSPEECPEFLKEGGIFRFDLFRIPFNEGRGGKAEPLAGASNNGMSNYFARYSPDGKWIVFCKAKSFMLLQPDSELYIIPASGGEARRLQANTARMNSWHSWSPNGKWLVFSSKGHSLYTQLFLTHIDEAGNSTPAVLLRQFTAPDRAANIPEFVHAAPDAIQRIHQRFVDDESYVRAGGQDAFYGDYDLAGQAFQKAIEINPNNAAAYEAWGVVLVRQNRFAEALARLSRAIELEPHRKEAHLFAGRALVRLGRVPEAIEHHQEAVRLAPNNAPARVQLGSLLIDANRVEEGGRHLAEAVRLDPSNAPAHVCLGIFYLRQGLPDKAVACYRRALQADPHCTEAMLSLAQLLATTSQARLRDNAEALRLATKACELTRREDPQALIVLADALGGAGRLAEAAATAEAALQIAVAGGNAKLVRSIEERLPRLKQRNR